MISGHGAFDEAAVETCNGDYFYSSDIPFQARESSNLGAVIFESCHQGESEKIDKWTEALGSNKAVVGWEGPTTPDETRSFNNSGKNSRQRHNLRYYANQVSINMNHNKLLKGVLNAFNEYFNTNNDS